jgi:hypothetical protein
MTLSLNEIIQLGAVVVTLLAALVTTTVAAVVSIRLARQQRLDTKRQFCFELQRQFDSPRMFQCRFTAWRMLENGDFNSIRTVGELFKSEKWTFEVSAVIHFFESLERYCGEGLVDEKLASQLFGRTFIMWYERLLKRLTVDERSEAYAPWVDAVRKLHTRCLAPA